MQVSTREEDFLVDTLALRPHLQILNKSFTDPHIIKVANLSLCGISNLLLLLLFIYLFFSDKMATRPFFVTEKVLHGADQDIAWLQKDFGVYLVNMFDTGQAARTLRKMTSPSLFLDAPAESLSPSSSFFLEKNNKLCACGGRSLGGAFFLSFDNSLLAPCFSFCMQSTFPLSKSSPSLGWRTC
jgi:hypothetical protein